MFPFDTLELDINSLVNFHTGAELIYREDGTLGQRIIGRPSMEINCVYQYLTKQQSYDIGVAVRDNAGKDIVIPYLGYNYAGRVVSPVRYWYDVHWYGVSFIFKSIL